MSILKVENLEANIGIFEILQNINVDIQQGEAVAILGRNGAGKTTFLRTVMGLVKVKAGNIQFDNESINNLAPHKISRKGVGYCPEDADVFLELTIQENLRLSMHKEDEATQERLEKVLNLFPDLKRTFLLPAKTLSGGQKQMLSISRALMNDNKMILIDEPSKGLAPVIVEKMALALKEISKTTTVILVEQNFNMACAVADRFYIIDSGETTYEGKIKDLIQDKELQRQHLGL